MGIGIGISKIALGGNKGSSYWSTRNPTGLTAVVYSDTIVDLFWTNTATKDYTGHKIYSSTDNVNFTLFETVIGILSSARVSGLTVNTLYYFKVAPYNATSESGGVVVSAMPIYWWLAGGLTALDCVAAYSPKDKVTLASSYPNLNNPGTNDLNLGNAPTLHNLKAWYFKGSDNFLKTGIIVSANYSAIIAFADFPNITGSFTLFGAYSTAGSTKAFLIQNSLSGTPLTKNFVNGGALNNAPNAISGTLGFTGGSKAFTNGIEEATAMTGSTELPLIELYLGALNVAGTKSQVFQGKITGYAVYNKVITPAQYLAVHNNIPKLNTQNVLDYRALNFGAFLCWSLSTFYGVDAGYVDGDIEIFNPTDLDIDEWLDTFVIAGMNYACICAQTEDGFCLWPTSFADPGHTPYGIGSTSWYTNNGNYDITKHFVDGCNSRGLKPVIYMSIRDLTHEARSGTDETTDAATYIAMILTKLNELLHNYGDITAIWIDDWSWHISYANIPYETICNYIKSIQPNCLVIVNEHIHPCLHGDLEVYEPATADGHVAAGNERLSTEVETIRLDNVWSYNEALDQTAAALMTKAQINTAVAQANGRNSNYKLGISPDKTGHLTAAQKTILESLQT